MPQTRFALDALIKPSENLFERSMHRNPFLLSDHYIAVQSDHKGLPRPVLCLPSILDIPARARAMPVQRKQGLINGMQRW
jgi:hypothetical protein